MKDKLGLILGVGIALAALMGLLFFLKNGGRFELIEYIYVLLVLLIVAGTSIILWKRTKDDRHFCTSSWCILYWIIYLFK
jgi:hypothetical protein